MTKHNGYTDATIAPRQTGMGQAMPAATPAPLPERADRVLSFLTSVLLLGSVCTLTLVCVPTLWQLTELQARQAQALEEREAAGTRAAETLAGAHRRLAVEQAKVTAAQAQTRQLAEDNLRLAQEINDRLREK